MEEMLRSLMEVISHFQALAILSHGCTCSDPSAGFYMVVKKKFLALLSSALVFNLFCLRAIRYNCSSTLYPKVFYV
jgi:hypothetical protein